jgi:hypothetical protein
MMPLDPKLHIALSLLGYLEWGITHIKAPPFLDYKSILQENKRWAFRASLPLKANGVILV